MKRLTAEMVRDALVVEADQNHAYCGEYAFAGYPTRVVYDGDIDLQRLAVALHAKIQEPNSQGSAAAEVPQADR